MILNAFIFIIKAFIMKTLDFLKTNFSLLVILVLIAIIVFQRSCSPATSDPIVIEKPVEIIRYDVDTIKIPIQQVVYKPGKTVYKEVPIYIEVPKDIDTLNILKEYFAINVYKDTLFLKENIGYVSIIDSISQNQIKSRAFNAFVEKIILTNTVYVKAPPRTQFFGGVGIGLQKPNSLILSGQLTMKSKTDKLYSIGLGINSDLQPGLYGSMQWKLFNN